MGSYCMYEAVILVACCLLDIDQTAQYLNNIVGTYILRGISATGEGEAFIINEPFRSADDGDYY